MDNNNQNTNPYGSSDNSMSGQNQYGNANPADNNMYQNNTTPNDAYNTGSYNNGGSYNNTDSSNNAGSYNNTDPSNNAGSYNNTDPYNNASYNNTGSYNNDPSGNMNQSYQNTSGSYNYSSADYYNQPAPQQSSSNGYAVASLILGIISIPLGCCYGIGILSGIIAIVLAFVGKKNNDGSFGGMGITGIICSCFGILFGVLFWVFFLIGLSQMSSSDMDSILNSMMILFKR